MSNLITEDMYFSISNLAYYYVVTEKLSERESIQLEIGKMFVDLNLITDDIINKQFNILVKNYENVDFSTISFIWNKEYVVLLQGTNILRRTSKGFLCHNYMAFRIVYNEGWPYRIEYAYNNDFIDSEIYAWKELKYTRVYSYIDSHKKFSETKPLSQGTIDYFYDDFEDFYNFLI